MAKARKEGKPKRNPVNKKKRQLRLKRNHELISKFEMELK